MVFPVETMRVQRRKKVNFAELKIKLLKKKFIQRMFRKKLIYEEGKHYHRNTGDVLSWDKNG